MFGIGRCVPPQPTCALHHGVARLKRPSGFGASPRVTARLTSVALPTITTPTHCFLAVAVQIYSDHSGKVTGAPLNGGDDRRHLGQCR